MPHGPVDRSSPLLEHAMWVRGLCRALARDAGEAKDFAQEAMMAALQKPPGTGVPVKRWFALVVRSLRRQALRSDARLPGVGLSATARITQQRTPRTALSSTWDQRRRSACMPSRAGSTAPNSRSLPPAGARGRSGLTTSRSSSATNRSRSRARSFAPTARLSSPRWFGSTTPRCSESSNTTSGSSRPRVPAARKRRSCTRTPLASSASTA